MRTIDKEKTMKRQLNIRSKISLYVLVPLALYIIFIIIYVSIKFSNISTAQNNTTNNIIAERTTADIHAIIKEHQQSVCVLADALSGNTSKLNEAAQQSFAEIIGNAAKKHRYWALLKSDFFGNSKYTNEWLEIMIDEQQNIIITDNKINIENKFADILTSSTTKISEPYEYNGKWRITISTPIYQDNNICGFICKAININDFDAINKNYEKSYNTNIDKHLINNNNVVVYSNITTDINQKFTIGCTDSITTARISKAIAEGTSFTNSFKNRGQTSKTYFTPINISPNCKWTLAVTIPTQNVTGIVASSLAYILIISILGLIIIVLLILRTTNKIVLPIIATTEALRHLALGDTDNIKPLQVTTQDELEEMSKSLNQVVDGIRKSETFALNIGDGNYDSQFDTLSNKDRLGYALIKLRDNLIENKHAEAKRKEEEELRNWTTGGIAKFGEILRRDHDNIKALSYNIMSNLIDYLKVNQGALFIINNENENDVFYTLTAAIAYERDKYINKDIRSGEGLVGRCIYEHKTIYLTKVPSNYAYITSGLGAATPSCVLIVPCILNNEVFAIIEIASFDEIKPHEIEFVEKLGESIASTISNVKVTEKTSKLLQASQSQREELTSQEEMLRQNLEEMQATQEDLRRQMEENHKIKDALSKEKYLMDSLMDNVSDLIYFKDKNSRFIKVSKSYVENFGAQSQDDIIGKTDFDICEIEADAKKYYNDEQNIIKTQKPILNVIQEELRQGQKILTSTSKYPLLDEQGNPIGTFGLTTNVTDILKKYDNSKNINKK